MNRFLLLFLAAATIFLTPAGVFMCGSLVLTDHKPGADLTVPCETPFGQGAVETAVLNYLSTPVLTHTIAFGLTFLSAIVVILNRGMCPTSLKRKPPTRPPKFSV